jgi:magnesium-transporting ATPase (P-type)
MRQRAVTYKINNKIIENLWISRTFKKYVPINWSDCKPGAIIRVKSGQEFPADCLILDIAGAFGQKCYVTSGPFDDSTGIIQKKSYSATSNKASSSQHNNEQHMSDMISGILKFEYNYFGQISGSFKLNENPAAIDFDIDNVVQRGALLTNTPHVTCLVLNVGDQCMGSVYKDPNTAMDSATH